MYTDRFGRISPLRSGERNFRSRCGGYGHRQPVRRAQHAATAGAIQHVRVDHRRRHIRVTEQLLDRPDVVPVLEKVRREGVPERVASHSLRRAARQRRRSNRTLQTLLVHVMPSPNSAPQIDRQLPGRKQPLPRPLASRIRVLPRKCVWQPDSRHTIRAVFLRQHPQPFEVRRQSPFHRLGQRRNPILSSLSVSYPDLATLQVHNAWFWVEAETCPSTARCVRYALISSAPIDEGCRLL